MDKEAQLCKWDFVSVLPALPLPPPSDPFSYLYPLPRSEKHKLLARKAYEEDLDSNQSSDTTLSDLIPFTESARPSMVSRLSVSGTRESISGSRQTWASFGTSDPPSARRSVPNSDLASFQGDPLPEENSEELQAVEIESTGERGEVQTQEVVATPKSSPEAAQYFPPRPATPAVSARFSFLSNFDLSSGASSPSHSQVSAQLSASPVPPPSVQPPKAQVPISKSRPRVLIQSADTPERRPWSAVTQVEENTAKASRKRKKPDKDEGPRSLFDDDTDVYKVAYFIPRTAFTPTHLVAAEIDQQMAIHVPGLKVMVLKLLPGQTMEPLVNPQGDMTGSILRSQRNKLQVRVHTNEHGFSQGDYFYVPRGNALMLSNKSDRMSAILQLVITKNCA